MPSSRMGSQIVRLTSLTFFLLVCSSISAQVTTNVTPTGKHAKAANKYKKTKGEFDFAKKKIKVVKRQVQARKEYEAHYDSLAQVYVDSIHSDSLQVEWISEEDSIMLAHQLLRSGYLPPEYELLITTPLVVDSTSVSNADSILLARGVQELENVAAEYLPEQSDVRALDINAPPNKPNPNDISLERAQELFAMVDMKEFTDVQNKVNKLKRKYTKLPDTKDLSAGTRKNSLSDVPKVKRLGLNGSINLKSTDPLILATNLQLGYWLNKKWQSGVGLVFSQQLNQRDSVPQGGDTFGHSCFLRYTFFKNFFSWGEYSRQLNRSLFSSNEGETSEWQNAYLLGIGSEFKIGKVRMTSTLLYDFNYRNNTINQRPFVFRLGVNLTKRPW